MIDRRMFVKGLAALVATTAANRRSARALHAPVLKDTVTVQPADGTAVFRARAGSHPSGFVCLDRKKIRTVSKPSDRPIGVCIGPTEDGRWLVQIGGTAKVKAG